VSPRFAPAHCGTSPGRWYERARAALASLERGLAEYFDREGIELEV
jgi:hypothetical protein